MAQDSAGECLCDCKFLSPWAGLELFFFPGSFAPFAAFWPPNTLLADAVRAGGEDEQVSKAEGKNLRPNLLRAVKWITQEYIEESGSQD